MRSRFDVPAAGLFGGTRPLSALSPTSAMSSLYASSLLPRHEHHHTAEQIDTGLPRGNLIFVHAGLQALAWGLVFPIGMALGLKKSRWHVPCQVLGLCMTGAGYILGASCVVRANSAVGRGRTGHRFFGRADLRITS